MQQDLDHDFTQVDAHDIPLLKKYLALAAYEEANHNLVGFMTWLDAYPLWKLEGEIGRASCRERVSTRV